MVTNKCKSDFENWLKEQPVAPYVQMFDSIPLIVQQSYLLQFFDGTSLKGSARAGIYIDTFATFEVDGDFNYFDLWINTECMTNKGFKTREEALTEGIKLANEIYNKNADR